MREKWTQGSGYSETSETYSYVSKLWMASEGCCSFSKAVTEGAGGV